MFVRKKRNRSGAISVQIIEKTKGFRVLKTVGCSNNPEEVERFFQQGKAWIAQQERQLPLFFADQKERAVIEAFVSQLANNQVRTVGPELIFGRLFDEIGFGKIADELFRHIVIARLAYPTSKLKTVDYLKRYQAVDMDVDRLYRFLDRVHERHKEAIETNSL